MVFCSVDGTGLVQCGKVALDKGLSINVFVWNKPDLRGASHTGGPRQATSSEYVVAVHKHANPSTKSLQSHYSLLDQKAKLEVRANVMFLYIFT